MCKYDYLFSNERIRKSTIMRNNSIDDFYSDRSRIIYSSSFRRLQQKAQVFSLEANSNVRTRLTHSIEVSDLGKTLANKIGFRLKADGLIGHGKIPELVAIVENACLMHDIGNPPFGHFGEDAIRKWSKANMNEDMFKKARVFRKDTDSVDYKIHSLKKDFEEFDGNPQGFRIVSKLHCERDEYSLNMTISSLLCALKYVRTSSEKATGSIDKKVGYFQTEKGFVEELWCRANMSPHTRYPFTYIMEAADDIAYCLSDIADGIEKNIVQPNEFLNEIKNRWNEQYRGEYPVVFPQNVTKENFAFTVSVPWSHSFIDCAAQSFIDNVEGYMKGINSPLITENSTCGKFIATIKEISHKLLYKSEPAENIELAGYSMIYGILNKFQHILELPYSDFKEILEDKNNNYPLESRLLHRIGPRYVKRYKFDVDHLNANSEHFAAEEWWYRAHMIIDHISGMTDDYALTTYQILYGIKFV